MSSDQKITQSTAYAINANQWPKFDGYQPLSQDPERKQIRLLNLIYDIQAKRISCALIHHDLGDELDDASYYALSYYWGAPSSEREIEVDNTRVSVRKTVYDFLKALGRYFGSVRVWLDVLCINQGDITERSQQVLLMYEIFSEAKGVFAWLGKGDADSAMLFEVLQAVEEKQGEISNTSSLNSATQLLYYAERLLTHPYFTRVWIIQECAVAETLYLMCGPNVIERRIFIQGIQEIKKIEGHARRQAPKLHNRKHYLSRHAETLLRMRVEDMVNQRPPLLDNMEKFSTARCTDPKDKIFGFRALSKEMNTVTVNYSRSIGYTILQALTAINQFPIRKTPEYLANAKRLLELMPLNTADILIGLEDAYGALVGDESLQHDRMTRTSQKLLCTPKVSLGSEYVATNVQFQCERDYICNRCTEVTHGRIASYYYGRTRLELGDLIYELHIVNFHQSALALVVRQDQNNQHMIVDLGLLNNESLDEEMQYERLPLPKERHFPPQDIQTISLGYNIDVFLARVQESLLKWWI